MLQADDRRATPAERLENGIDFDVTDRRVLFGHHFAAIAGAGPLVGPVLAAQMGYLPGTIWVIVGVIFAGAVQDLTVLFFSMRRNGKSLGQMVREEQAVFAVLVLVVVVNAVVVTARAVRTRGRLPTTEEPPAPSTLVEPAGLWPTAEEKEAMAEHRRLVGAGSGRSEAEEK